MTSASYVITASTLGTAQQLVAAVGGRITAGLPIVNGVVADIPTVRIPVLVAIPGVVVAPNIPVFATGMGSLGTSTGRTPAAVFPDTTGASQLGADGVTGRGVNVAVLDTGIDRLPDFAGRLVAGIDLSGGGDPFQDLYGHGTFVAGIVAGDGTSSGGLYRGEAPGAGLISVKVAGSSGATDMATVIAGIGWAVANAATDHIGVLNVSLGGIPFASTVLNPLDQAVEVAWHKGITVVTSAGNAGPSNGTIATPGDDPLAITAGASDDNGTVVAADDTMTSFSSVGPTSPDGWFKPDLVAPGRSLVSLRAPGSTIDTAFSGARIGAANFVGSGTSFSAAVVSGAAALVLQAGPAPWSPDAVKAKLLGTAVPGPVGNPFVDGHGALNAYAAAHAAPVMLLQPKPLLPTLVGGVVSLAQRWSTSTWNGANWTAVAPSAANVNGEAWNGEAWNGEAWNGEAWNGEAWNGEAWNGEAWNGEAWNGEAWNGEAWNGEAWNGEAWNGEAWN
ncbi:MAG TPA: S8 family serine peptidase [Acidimicrobiales bacterium]|nr:S8 family serine peptidase [Acidimicrobiales bacterium]